MNFTPSSKIRFFVAGIFLFGVLTGVGLMNFIAAKTKAPQLHSNNNQVVWLNTIDSEVGLKAEQKEQVATIIKSHCEQAKEIMKIAKPQLDELKKITRANIRAQLNADQQARYDRMLQRKDAEKAALASTSPSPFAAPKTP